MGKLTAYKFKHHIQLIAYGSLSQDNRLPVIPIHVKDLNLLLIFLML